MKGSQNSKRKSDRANTRIVNPFARLKNILLGKNIMDAELANELLKGVYEITESKKTDNSDLKMILDVDTDEELEEALENDNAE